MPSTCASSSSASSRGVSQPAAAIAVIAPSSASRTAVPRTTPRDDDTSPLTLADIGYLRLRRPARPSTRRPSSRGRGLGLQPPRTLVRLQGRGELVELAFEDLIEVVHGQLDAVIGDAALAVVIGADLLGAIAGADLRATVGRELGLLFGQRALIQPRAQHAQRLL